eukprot:2176837-Pyramimonas_sp.AAC.1
MAAGAQAPAAQRGARTAPTRLQGQVGVGDNQNKLLGWTHLQVIYVIFQFFDAKPGGAGSCVRTALAKNIPS